MSVRPSVLPSGGSKQPTFILLDVVQLPDHVQVLQQPDVARGIGMTRFMDWNQFLRIVGINNCRRLWVGGVATAGTAQVHSGEEIGEHRRPGRQDVFVHQKFSKKQD